MRQDYPLDSLKSTHTSLLDWSLQNAKKEPPFQLKNNDKWDELGEIDVAAQSPKPHQQTTTPVQRPRRHRCISDDSKEDEPQHDSCSELEREFFDLKPKSLNACFATPNKYDCEVPLPILSMDEEQPSPTSLRAKRSREENDFFEDCERQRTSSRKRRRVAGRNNALCAQDYNEIFSQLGC